jgi:mRNA interferase MazF
MCALRQVGPHPVVVLTRNNIALPLSAVTVAVITGTAGPTTTHIPLGPDAGLTSYDVSYVNCTDLQTVGKPQLRRKLGLLAREELRSVESSIRLILGL